MRAFRVRFPAMPPRFLLAAALALALSAPLALAQSVKPVPVPDLSSLPAASAAELRKARADFDKSRDIVSGEALAENYGILASAYARAGFTEAAAVAFDNAILTAPRDMRWLYARGVLALAMGQQAEATRDFERAFAITRDYLPLRTALANQKMGAGDLDGARQLLEEYTARQHGQAVPYAMLGEIALRQKRHADAIRNFELALEAQPQATRLYAQLAEAYAAGGNGKAAAEARAKAGTVAPLLADPVGSRLLPEIGQAAPGAASAAAASAEQRAIAEAVTATAKGDYPAARAALDALLKQELDNATALAFYARVEAAAGRLDAAQARAAAAVRADAKSPLARLAQGSVLEMKGDDRGAERAYTEAIRLAPGEANPRLALAGLLLRGGRTDAALQQYRAVLSIDPASPAAWIQVAAIEAAAGRCAAVLKDVHGALARAPDSPGLMQVFVRLASTCPAASAAERRMALDYAGKLYQGAGAAPAVAESYALALAANGKWDDAVATQQGAMFSVLRSGGAAALAPYREFLELFQAHKLSPRPWPSSSEVYRPQPPTAGSAAGG